MDRQTRAAPPDKQRLPIQAGTFSRKWLRTQGQPRAQRSQRRGPHGHAAAAAALALHLHLGGLQINPAAPLLQGLAAGHHVQAHQLTYAQATAIQQLNHGAIARLLPGIDRFGMEVCQAHGLVHRQRFGQRFGRAWRTHIQQRVPLQQPFAHRPGVKAAPARQNQGNAARAAPTTVHLRHQPAHVRSLQLQQLQPQRVRAGLQALQVVRVEHQGALGQALVNAQVLQVAHHLRRQAGRGRNYQNRSCLRLLHKG